LASTTSNDPWRFTETDYDCRRKASSAANSNRFPDSGGTVRFVRDAGISVDVLVNNARPL
jgi:hypothetical protein